MNLPLLITLFLFQSVANSLAESKEDDVSCTPDSTDPCISPVATGTAEFQLKPLFPKNVTMVYGIDFQTPEEADDQTPIAKGAIWLEYDDSTLNSSANMLTEMRLILNETITGTPGGGHNGCDNIWASVCSQDLVSFLKKFYRIAAPHTDGEPIPPRLPSVLNWTDFRDNRVVNNTVLDRVARNVSCPAALLAALPYGTSKVLAVESENNSWIDTPGNSSAAQLFSNFTLGRFELEQPYDLVSLAIIARAPIDPKLYNDTRNIQIDLVCIKPTPIPGAMPTSVPTTTPTTNTTPTPTGSATVPSILWSVFILVFISAMASVLL